MTLSGETRLLGVIGHPIRHSLSPKMHNAAFAAFGLDFVYVPMDVSPGNLGDAVRGLRVLGFRGFNVTMPHKEEIIPFLDDLDEVARVSGAVNTVLIEDGNMLGMNTDGSGFLEACCEAGVKFRGKRVLVVGAGGASAAVCTAMLGEDLAELRVVNRTPERAENLGARLRDARPDVALSVHAIEELGDLAAGADVLVNTTYLGMKDEDPLPIPERAISTSEAVCDAVYRKGSQTRLVEVARKQGVKTVSGERMLIYQGVQAYRVWTGENPDVEVMSRALV